MSAPSAKYVQLGKSGLRISVPILGAMSYGNPKWASMQWVLDEEHALPIMKAAWDRGINTIDTANVYSNGDSERIVAKFIEKYQIPRDEIVILTKCFNLTAKEHDHDVFTPAQLQVLRQRKEYVNWMGLSRAAIFNAVEESLKRLNTSCIDLYQIHRFDPDTPPEETMKALHDLVESGKVRYIGASSMRTWQFALLNEVAEKHGWTKFVSMQDEYSLTYREEEREMIPYCKYHGIGLIPYSPLAGGALARSLGSQATPRSKALPSYGIVKAKEIDNETIRRVEEIAEKRGWAMSQVALAWVLRNVSSPIVGFNSIKRVDQGIVAGELTDEEAKYLEEPYQPRPIRGHA
uniref:NADP-dependent oxidoreductase domain-containing protein n=1 Tax=Schizophyllum commune (strain H4-8 / FGSC 9210) TaxID=578458 RepID=D8Q4S2_SCHCM